jgi:predicted PurR-regulated permease PerM
MVKAEPSHRGSAGLAGALASIILILVLLYLGRIFFVTLVSAVLLAFILEPAVNLFMRLKCPRATASFLACSLMLGVLYLLGLGLWSQVLDMWSDLPAYSERVGQLVENAVQQIEGVEKNLQDAVIPKRLRESAPPVIEQKQPAARRRPRSQPPPPPAETPVQEVRIRPEQTPLVRELYSRLAEAYDSLLMASFVPFLVYFFLSWRDHVRRSLVTLAGAERKDTFQRAWDGIANVARAYVVGNFLLGVILSTASGLFFWYLNLPYWQVIGPVSGFLSLVPYLGLPLAMAPPIVAALPVYTGLPAYLIIASVVAVLHLTALNLLYPKVVGGRVHLNPLVVTVALMVWYLVWGGAGLVLAIPITAAIKAAFDQIPSLREYGRLMGD